MSVDELGRHVGLMQLEAGNAIARYDSTGGYPEHPRHGAYHPAESASQSADGSVITIIRRGLKAERLPSPGAGGSGCTRNRTSSPRLLVSLTVDRVLAETRFRCPGWSLSFAAVHVLRACDSQLDCAAPVTEDGRERLKKGMLCS